MEEWKLWTEQHRKVRKKFHHHIGWRTNAEVKIKARICWPKLSQRHAEQIWCSEVYWVHMKRPLQLRFKNHSLFKVRGYRSNDCCWAPEIQLSEPWSLLIYITKIYLFNLSGVRYLIAFANRDSDLLKQCTSISANPHPWGTELNPTNVFLSQTLFYF